MCWGAASLGDSSILPLLLRPNQQSVSQSVSDRKWWQLLHSFKLTLQRAC